MCFFLNQAIELLKNTRINKPAIELIEEKELSYRPIYALNLVKLETLKAYIKTHLRIRFIWPFKSLVNIPIFFGKKSDGSFYLCMDY